VCDLLLRTRAKRRKRFLVTSTCKSKITERTVPKAIRILACVSTIILGYFRMTCSSFYELLSLISHKITYRNTVIRASVSAEERLAVTLR
jgi:hypothetical protein